MKNNCLENIIMTPMNKNMLKALITSTPSNSRGRIFPLTTKKAVVLFLDSIPKGERTLAAYHLEINSNQYYLWKKILNKSNMANQGVISRNTPKSVIGKKIESLKQEIDKLIELERMALGLGIEI